MFYDKFRKLTYDYLKKILHLNSRTYDNLTTGLKINLKILCKSGPWLTNHHPSVLRHYWLGHLTHKIVPKMTYNVSSGILNPTIQVQAVITPGIISVRGKQCSENTRYRSILNECREHNRCDDVKAYKSSQLTNL